MDKFKNRLSTVCFAFAFPLFMAIAMSIANPEGLLINGENTIIGSSLFYFVFFFGAESSLFVFVAVCYLIYKGE